MPKQLELYHVCPKECLELREEREEELKRQISKLKIELQAARRLMRQLLDTGLLEDEWVDAYSKNASREAKLFLEHSVPEPERSRIEGLR